MLQNEFFVTKCMIKSLHSLSGQVVSFLQSPEGDVGPVTSRGKAEGCTWTHIPLGGL